MKSFTPQTIFWLAVLFYSLNINAQSVTISPDTGFPGAPFDVTVTGTGTSWMNGESYCVSFTNGTSSFSFIGQVSSSNDQITGSLDIPRGSVPGDYNVSIIGVVFGECVGTSAGSCTDCFTIPEPSFTIDANTGKRGDALSVIVTGINTTWANNTSHCVKLTNDTTTILFTGTVSNSTPNEFRGFIEIPMDANLGDYDAVVYDNDNGNCFGEFDGICSGCFTVTDNNASISFSPSSGKSGESFTIDITGLSTSWSSNASQCIELTDGTTTFNFFAEVAPDTINFLTGTITIPVDASAGSYDAKVYDSETGDCFGVSDGLCNGCFNINTLISTNEQNAALRIYPNPTNGQLFVEHPAMRNATNLQIYDVLGRLVYEQQSIENNMNNIVTINTATLNNGLYLLVIVDDDEKKIFEFIKSE